MYWRFEKSSLFMLKHIPIYSVFWRLLLLLLLRFTAITFECSFSELWIGLVLVKKKPNPSDFSLRDMTTSTGSDEECELRLSIST